MANHLIFFDGECGLCDQIVQIVLKHDHDKQFDFAPLQGSTAAAMLKDLPPKMKSADSLVLIENYKSNHPKTSILGEGALKISWLLGGSWKILGAFWWLPKWSYNWVYRLVAKNRHRLFNNSCVVPTLEDKDRFLP